MSFAFDPQQQEAIRSQVNTVVTAGAGSGKTTVLAERFCWLLEQGKARVDQILTLTFTQKAAAEMYERIYARLKQSQSSLIAEQVQDFAKAQISTLDSFCAQIVRDTCESFGVPADFEVEETRLGRLAAEAGLDFILARQSEEAMRELIRLHGFDRLWHELFSEIALRHLSLAGSRDFPRMVEEQLAFLKQTLRRLLGDWEDARREILALKASGQRVREAREALRAAGDLGGLADRQAYPELTARLAGLKMRKPGGKATEESLRFKDLADRINSETEQLALIAQTLNQEGTLRGVFLLLAEFQDLFNARKRSLGLLGFQDVAELAVQALILNKPLREYYKSRFRFIMIDEFQDNNRLQKDLLYLLAEKGPLCGDGVPAAAALEPGKLFFVGDEKQSIYRFRGADVSVFKALSRELIEQGGREIELSINYRSEAGLIDFFNAIFPTIMAEATEGYEARYRELKAHGPQGDLVPRIDFFYRPDASGPETEQPAEEEEAGAFSKVEEEAFTVAGYLRETVQTAGLTVRDEAGLRPAGFSDFTVLLRSTGNQIVYERMFRALDIPYSTQNVRSLFLEPPFNDMYNLLQLAVYPEDRLAYAGLLRSPFVHVSDSTLIRLLLEGDPPFERIDLEGIGGEDREKLAEGRSLYRFIQEQAGNLPLPELIHQLWHRRGYRFFVLQNPRNHNYLEYFDYLFKLAEETEQRGEGLARFLDFLRSNLGSYEKLEDLEILKQEVSGVQLMTIHKAKGLEFPIVLLADTGNRGRAESGKKPFYAAEPFGITVNLGDRNYFTLAGEKESEKKEIAELKRLLYVALTRAKSHLILSGIHSRQNQGSRKAHLNMLFEALGPRKDLQKREDREEKGSSYRFSLWPIGPLTDSRFYSSRAQAEKIEAQKLAPLYLEAAVIDRRAPRREYAVSELNSLLEEQLPGRGTAGEEALLPALPCDPVLREKNLEAGFGTLTHRLLAESLMGSLLPEVEPDWQSLNIPVELRAALLQDARLLCTRFLDSPLGRRSLQAERRECEVPFLYRFEAGSGTYHLSGQIDLFFEARGECFLIDFKTDRTFREGAYGLQLWLYAQALLELQGKEPRSFLFLLRSGEAIPFKEEADFRGLLEDLLK